MDWFRSYHGAPTDAKYLMLAKRAEVAPFEVAFVWWAFMDYASQNLPRGSIAGFDAEALSCFSGLEEEKIHLIKAVCREKGMIDAEGVLTAWQRRQPRREDDSSKRVKALRERQKVQDDSVTQCNADVTQCNARTEQSRTEEIRTEQIEPPLVPPFGGSAQIFEGSTEVPEAAQQPADQPAKPATAESKPRGHSRATQLPEDFQLTEELIVYATSRLPGVQVAKLFEQFQNHFIACGKAQKSWPRTWRTWVDKAEQFGYPGQDRRKRFAAPPAPQAAREFPS